MSINEIELDSDQELSTKNRKKFNLYYSFWLEAINVFAQAHPANIRMLPISLNLTVSGVITYLILTIELWCKVVFNDIGFKFYPLLFVSAPPIIIYSINYIFPLMLINWLLIFRNKRYHTLYYKYRRIKPVAVKSFVVIVLAVCFISVILYKEVFYPQIVSS